MTAGKLINIKARPVKAGLNTFEPIPPKSPLAKIKEMAENYGRKEEEVKDNPELVKYVGDSLKTEKTIDFLVENAKIK